MPDLHSPSEWLRVIARNARRLFILIVGVAVLAAGVAMLVLPGPGLIVVIVGLLILATEFAWAERVLDRTTEKAADAATTLTGNRKGQALLAVSGVGMIVAGIVLAVIAGDLLVVGISIAVAGGIGLATLLPPVRAWIDEKANGTSS